MNSKEMFQKIFELGSNNNYSDIHLNSGKKPIIRDKQGDIQILSDEFEILTIQNIKDFIVLLSNIETLEIFEENLELDTSYALKNNKRYRANCYVDSNGYNIALRLIPNEIPNLKQLGLGDNVVKLCNKSKGLILVTGPTGSGKSTNLAGMIDYINSNFNKHIITIEDPIEFSFKDKKSLINQREIGNHTKGFKNAMKSILREDPDVIMLGEMRDPETIKTAITLAETGHLVLSTLHTNDSVQTIDRIIDIFPGSQQTQIRMQLSQSLIGIISQRLVPRLDLNGRLASREILINNDAIRNLIIGGKTHQIYSVLEVGIKDGMILMDKYLLALYKKKLISKDILMSYIRDRETIEMLIANS